MTFKQILMVGSAFCLLAGTAPAMAANGWLTTYKADLAGADIAAAGAVAEAQVREAPESRSAHFAAGTAKFLEAVETFGQTLHRYGMQSTYQSNFLGGLPFVSLPVPANPDPEPVTYQKLRDALQALSDGLDAAEAELAAVPPGPFSMRLDLVQIRLDMAGSGNAAGAIPLGKLIFMLVGGYGADRMFEGTPALPIDFDESDVLWLRAYCHLLAAMSDFMLGYDWQASYDASFYGIFPSGTYPPSAVIDGVKADLKRLAEIGPVQLPPGMYPFSADYTEWVKTPDGQRYQQASDIQHRLDAGAIADLIAFVHTAHWPVADAAKLAGVHDHLKQVVALSRANWKSILAETDDGNELLPNPGQHGVLSGLRMDQQRIDGWLAMLDQFDRLLDGTLLIPHWRLEKGINLKRFLLEPTPFDPLLLGTGQAATPYVEDGPKADPVEWSRITNVFGGDFLRYFFWIN